MAIKNWKDWTLAQVMSLLKFGTDARQPYFVCTCKRNVL